MISNKEAEGLSSCGMESSNWEKSGKNLEKYLKICLLKKYKNTFF